MPETMFLCQFSLCTYCYTNSTFPCLFSFDEPWSISDQGLNYDIRAICIRGNIGILPIWVYVCGGIDGITWNLKFGYCQYNWNCKFGHTWVGIWIKSRVLRLCKLNQGIGLMLTRHKWNWEHEPWFGFIGAWTWQHVTLAMSMGLGNLTRMGCKCNKTLDQTWKWPTRGWVEFVA